MLLLTSTSDLIQIVTGGTQSVQVHASYVDLSGTTPTPGRQNTIITTATTTTAVGSPGASTQRTVKLLSIRNTGTSAETVTVQHTDGTNVVQLQSLTLSPGYAFVYNEGSGWTLYDSAGNIQTSVGPGRLLKTTVLTTTSASTFTTGTATNTIRIRMVGGGGGGGGSTSVTSAAAAAGGGGGGSYLEKTVGVQPNTGYSYQCGTAGAANSGAAGGNGGSSTFTVGGTTYTAPGGTGGPAATSTTTAPSTFAGGAGGVVSTNGDVNGAGDDGQMGVMTAVTPVGTSGNGGSGPFGGGGAALTAAGAGNAGKGFGAGGGGSLTGSATARAGGAGTQGVIVVDEYS